MTTYNELLSAATEKGWDEWNKHEEFSEGWHDNIYTMTNIQKWLRETYKLNINIYAFGTLWEWSVFEINNNNPLVKRASEKYELYEDALREGEMEAIKTIKK